jgi:hypothetical protein
VGLGIGHIHSVAAALTERESHLQFIASTQQLRRQQRSMILILQIAAGIVLGFLIVQNLPRIFHVLNRIWRIALIFAALAGLIVLGLVLESARDSMTNSLGGFGKPVTHLSPAKGVGLVGLLDGWRQ